MCNSSRNKIQPAMRNLPFEVDSELPFLQDPPPRMSPRGMSLELATRVSPVDSLTSNQLPANSNIATSVSVPGFRMSRLPPISLTSAGAEVTVARASNRGAFRSRSFETGVARSWTRPATLQRCRSLLIAREQVLGCLCRCHVVGARNSTQHWSRSYFAPWLGLSAESVQG